jgi:hypothetical protein
VTFEHNSDGTNDPAPLPDAGSTPVESTGTFSWGSISSDTTPKTADFSGTSFTASDWGGDGRFTSVGINVTDQTEATITATGSSEFNNAPAEFFNFFYSLDGGSPVNFISGIETIDVSEAAEMNVGFAFNHDGGDDNVTVSQLSVDAIPEPTSAFLGGLGLLTLLRRRR